MVSDAHKWYKTQPQWWIFLNKITGNLSHTHLKDINNSSHPYTSILAEIWRWFEQRVRSRASGHIIDILHNNIYAVLLLLCLLYLLSQNSGCTHFLRLCQKYQYQKTIDSSRGYLDTCETSSTSGIAILPCPLLHRWALTVIRYPGNKVISHYPL